MSPEDHRQLLKKINDLEENVHDLNSEVTVLRRQVSRVRRKLADASRPSPNEEDSGASWDEVNAEDAEVEQVASRSRTSRASSARATPASVASPSPAPSTPSRSPSATPTPGGQSVPSWIQREAIADRIGEFIRRALEGDHRQSSGRDLVPLPSRIWVVAQDIHGGRYDPVRVFRSWTLTKSLVKIGAECGDSIFLGFPSEREARRAVHTAGLRWPSTIEG